MTNSKHVSFDNQRSPNRLVELWSRPAGFRQVLIMAIPLILSTGSLTVQHFVDRMFLCWYSPETMAAALPAGMFSFTLISFFIGTAAYSNTFVAQYFGASRLDRVGPSVWQAIYFSVAAGILLPMAIPFSGMFFDWAGHESGVRTLEVKYFNIVMIMAFFPVYNSAISGFFTGQGRNWPVMWINIFITIVNLLLDYGMIFGNWGFAEKGIEGAAWATNIANASGAVIFTCLYIRPKNQKHYATRSGWRWDRELFSRLLRFGAPSGFQFILDMLAFTAFVFIVGRIGTIELAATNVAFQINMLAFLPMIGLSIAVSTLVGQYLGADNPDLAARATWSAFVLTFAYMAFFAVLYVTIPDLFIDPFAAKADPANFAQVRKIAIMILYFVAAYSIFDTMNLIFSSALKGAGDTRFVMLCSLGLGWTIMVIPTWILCDRGNGGILTAWTLLSVFVVVLGFCFLYRFMKGKWRSMRVIESPTPHAAVPVNLPEVPTTEVDL